MGKQKLVDSAEALQKTVIGQKSDIHDSTSLSLAIVRESTRFNLLTDSKMWNPGTESQFIFSVISTCTTSQTWLRLSNVISAVDRARQRTIAVLCPLTNVSWTIYQQK